jgi:hypothetical protein
LPLRVFSIAPASGDPLGGGATTISGKGFSEDATLYIGGQPAPIFGVAPSEITTSTPALFPGTLNDVLVTSPAGVAQLTQGWFGRLDIPQADPFHADVEKVVRHHIAVGVGEPFRPQRSVTRADRRSLGEDGQRGGICARHVRGDVRRRGLSEPVCKLDRGGCARAVDGRLSTGPCALLPRIPGDARAVRGVLLKALHGSD